MKPDYVTVYTAAGQLQAEIIKSLLQSAGIPVQLAHESVGTVYAFTVGPLGEVEVRVPSADAAQAEALIAAMESGELNTDENADYADGAD